jgi:glycosyltransferase involved in cell wall biosynthesis
MIKNKLKISIAMTTFNGGSYLNEQLNSFLGQDTLPDELVIFDDGSTDETIQIISEFSKSSPFLVKLEINEFNVGVTSNFEKALNACSGDIIFISDQDDVWMPGKISKIIKLFEMDFSKKILIVANDAFITSDDITDVQGSLLKNVIQATGTQKDFVHGCCTAVRKEFLKIALPVPVHSNWKIGYDEWLHMAGNWLGARVIEKQPLQYYRRHNANVSNSVVYKPNVNFIDRAKYYLNRLKLLGNQENKMQWLKQQEILANCLLSRSLGKDISSPQLLNINQICVVIKKRIDLLKLGRIKKTFGVFRLYVFGKYQFFQAGKA